MQALGKIMLQLQHLCQDTVPTSVCMRERKGHALTRSMIAIVLRMRKSLTTSRLPSHGWLAAPPSREGFLTHRLSPVSGTAGGALPPHTSLQILISSPTTLLKPKLQSSNQIRLMEVGCMLFWDVVFSLCKVTVSFQRSSCVNRVNCVWCLTARSDPELWRAV